MYVMNLQDKINEYINYCMKQKNLSQLTIKAYKIDLAQFCSHNSNMSIDKENLICFVQDLHAKFKPKTVRRKIASVKAFIHYLCYQDYIENNPFDRIDTSFKEPKLLPRTIPERIIRQIFTAVYKNIATAASQNQRNIAIRNAAVIELLFATGARVSEICSLKTIDVDIDDQTVRIYGKGARERIIQIENSEVLSILKQYADTFSDNISENGFFFINNRRQRLSEQSVRIIIRNLENQIGSDIHITPHMFRHSMATLLLEEDVDIRYIQRILGHSSITTTQIYTHVTSLKQKEILKTKHPRNNIKMMPNWQP